MSISEKKIKAFHEKIFSWWRENRRDLPWRHTSDPYKIFVSEVMLQQTQVSRVLPVYQEFLKDFPTAKALAAAPTSDVLKAWKGMGYNRRALFLKKASEMIVEKFHGTFPLDETILRTLPGVGQYTARAILVFAFRKDVALIDTNIRQIITHFFFRDEPRKEKDIESLAQSLVPPGKSWEWHQALMDYGALALARDTKQIKRNYYGQKTISNKHVSISNQRKLPFRESDRFFRGRIMDALREKSYSEKALKAYMVESYGKDTEFIDRIMKGLEKDGLIKREKGMIGLP